MVEACPTAEVAMFIPMTKLTMHRLLFISFFITLPNFIILRIEEEIVSVFKKIC